MTSLYLQKPYYGLQNGFVSKKSGTHDPLFAAYPSYTKEILEHIHKSLQGKSGLRIAEIGSGSGIFTQAILSNPQWSSAIAEMKCIDPDAGLRAEFSKVVKDPRASTANGTFDETGVPDKWADLIVVASAFHYCNDLEAAIKEFIRILKSNGIVCFLWNPEDRAKWVQQIHSICTSRQDIIAGSASGHDGWRKVFDLPVYLEHFSAPEYATIWITESCTLEGVLDRFKIWSRSESFPLDKEEDLKQQIKVIIERGDELVWMDEKEGFFEVSFATPIITFIPKAEAIVSR